MRRLRTAATAAALVLGTGVAAFLAAPAATADTQICDQYGSTTIQGRYVVQNNRWGTSATQCINVTSTGFSITQSGANNPQNGAPASYPSVYYGCHYGNCSPGTILPLPVSNSAFNGISTSVSMNYPSSGVYDASYDIWFDPTARRDGQNTGLELMVWLNHTGQVQPIGSRIGSVSLAGGTWDVWFGNVGWNVVSYVRTSPTGSISFPVSAFYDDTVNRGYAQRSWYLTSIQAGFEPWVGGTGLAVTSFSVNTGSAPPQTTTTSTTRTTSSTTRTTTSSSSGGGTGACAATYTITNSWNGGFQADVAVRNSGSATINAWTVTWTYANGQKVTQYWNTALSGSPSVTARNLSYNGTLSPGATTTFGLQGTWTGSNGVPALSCRVG